jgi:hypothetical protein
MIWSKDVPLFSNFRARAGARVRAGQILMTVGFELGSAGRVM